MDISSVSGVASLATNSNNAQVSDAVGISVLNKALDAQVQGAAALIESIAETPQATALPDNVGGNVNVTA
ncbi:YjfB family protein [Thiorhodovibrio frisius]|uniref:Motility protein n=1 Tax=Thiorhodovibrio frisius TaxID=631362 RepID=H8Z4B2_9GAMM|nr:YjfB family protein [Thiorhodovibrio frisius]EIC20169.1 hypothetical protein Thi970DRAFT_03791 [Thiorhodovibrio frisius]WPL20906.1 hypothetical protein Thiofri_01012 [Thiorhodovibrio frisius]